MAEQTGDNVTIGGATYSIATDWGSGGGTGFTSAHVQVIKTSWGDTDNTFRVSKTTPLPIQIFDGVQGTTAAAVEASTGRLVVTGGVSINDSSLVLGTDLTNGIPDTQSAATTLIQIVGPTFGGPAGASGPTAYRAGAGESEFMPVKVTGSVRLYDGTTFGSVSFRNIQGATVGYIGGVTTGFDYINIQGTTQGTPVGITLANGDLDIRRLSGAGTPKDTIGVIGVAGATAVAVTGGIVVEAIPNGGSFETRSLVYGRDSVAVASIDGSTAAQVKLLAGNGTPIGSSAGALKVAVDNGNFTANVTIGPDTFIRNATGSSGYITVRGITSEEITVRGPLADGAIEVNSTSGLNTRALVNTTDNVDLGGTALTNLQSIKSSATTINNSLSTVRSNDLYTIKGKLNDIDETLKTLRETYTNAGVTASNTVRTSVSEITQPTLLVSYPLTVSRNARNFGNNSLKNGVNIQADPQNASSVVIGGRDIGTNSSVGYVLEPGDSLFLNISNTNQLYARSLKGNQKVNIIGT